MKLLLRLSISACAYAAVILLFSPLGSEANDFENQLQQKALYAEGAEFAYRSITEEDDSFVLVPVPIVDPTIGNGLAVAAIYTFASAEGEDQPRSTIAAAAGYTDTDSWAIAGGFNLHLDEDRYRLHLAAGLGEFNVKYYGVGGDSIFASNPVDFSASGTFVDGGLTVRLRESLYLGLMARYLDVEIATRLPIDALPTITVPFRLVGVGPTIRYDSRDNNWWPTAGWLISAEVFAYTSSTEIFSFEFEDRFAVFDVGVRSYRKLSDSLVLAGQTGLSFATEDTPFFMKPSVTVRGFPSGRFLDSVVLQAQGEARWSIWKGFGAVAFAGVGMTGGAISDIDTLAIGYGVGVRYRVSDVDRMNIGLDIASGDDDVAIYFRIGEAF